MISDADNVTEAYDIIVVGGGLLGAGIARDAAQRGLLTALYEAADYGAGGQNSRLALGGLSALGTLDFTRVREDIREREILLHIAPHLVRPQPCIVPFYSDGLLAQARLRAGLALSDALGFDHALRVHQLLSVRDAQKRAPGLNPDGLLGAARVWEAVVPQADRLARELAFDARRLGAALHPHTQVEALRRETSGPGRERVGGVRWKNALSGEQGRTDAALVILAAGSGQAALLGKREVSMQKTVSIFGTFLTGQRDALALPQEEAASLLLAGPHGANGGWAGGWAAEYFPSSPAYATGAEVAALLQALQAALPGLSAADIQAALATVQATPGEEISDAAAGGGRCDGLLSVSGAGLTQFRRVAEEAVDLACRKLGRALSVPPCRTASVPLPVLPPFSGSVPERVRYAVTEEDCLTLRDFLERRVPWEWTEAERRDSLPDALAALGECLRWDVARRAAEVKAWKTELALGQAFRVL